MVWLGVAVAVLALYVALRAFVVEPQDVETVEVDVPIADLPRELDGMRIVHLSDFHMHRYDDKERRVVAEVNAARPDLLCLTGDFIEESRNLAVLVPFLMEITRCRRTYAVLGNHDHREAVDAGALIEALQRSGAHVLVNEAATEMIRGVCVDIVGVDDPHTKRDDLDKALSPVRRRREGEEDGRFLLLLAHSPDIVSHERAKDADLVLCGHTHGGQVRAPFLGPIKTHTRIGRKVASGLVKYGGVRVYVTRGIGESSMRVRYGCRPEVTVLTLRRAG